MKLVNKSIFHGNRIKGIVDSQTTKQKKGSTAIDEL
jgi:hypothetical protein